MMNSTNTPHIARSMFRTLSQGRPGSQAFIINKAWIDLQQALTKRTRVDARSEGYIPTEKFNALCQKLNQYIFTGRNFDEGEEMFIRNLNLFVDEKLREAGLLLNSELDPNDISRQLTVRLWG